jgi:hypothetical protein
MFYLLRFIVVYPLNLVGATLILGALCGAAFALLTRCDTLKKTILSGIAGLVSAFAVELITFASGIARHIILYLLRDQEWIKETGRLTVNETIGFTIGTMLFWVAFLVLSVIPAIIFAIHFSCTSQKKQRRNSNE